MRCLLPLGIRTRQQNKELFSVLVTDKSYLFLNYAYNRFVCYTYTSDCRIHTECFTVLNVISRLVGKRIAFRSLYWIKKESLHYN